MLTGCSTHYNHGGWGFNMKNIVIIGATSAIAEAAAQLFAERGDRLYLLARNRERLDMLAQDLTVRGAPTVDVDSLDVTHFDSHQGILARVFSTLGRVDVVLIAAGSLPDQKACEADFGKMLEELNTNALGPLSLLTNIANRLEQQRRGTIAFISSVAGDRGRQSNYIYGAAKGMVSIYLQGLRNRLFKSGVNVLDIKPGFVDTPMTAAFKKGLLWAQPADVAEAILRGIDKKKSQVYAPFFWRYIMLVIRLIPEAVFKKLSL